MAVKPAPVLLSLSELAARVLGVVVTYPGPGPPLTAVLQPLVAVPSVQYSLKTALLTPAEAPITVRCQPEPLPVESTAVQFDSVALSVCALPFRTKVGRTGVTGAAVSESEPGVTANWVVSDAASAAELNPSSRPNTATSDTRRRARARVGWSGFCMEGLSCRVPSRPSLPCWSGPESPGPSYFGRPGGNLRKGNARSRYFLRA